jgi:tRNA-uridine 2-sulfurtransferase
MQLPSDLSAQIRDTIGLAGEPGRIRLVCAMSGGVDSSVAAALLKQAGFDVIGITLQLYDHGAAVNRKGSCCAGQDIHDARRVAAQIGIPHYVLDYESRFRTEVIDDFVASYMNGETPVPCIRCNQTVKFTDLIARAKALGAAALVTGHYVDSAPAADGSSRRELLTPADLSRDQSYFLFATTQSQLDYLRFPLGRIHKPLTRQIAAALGLVVAEKPDSQDICFVPDGRYAGLIAKLRPDAMEAGDIVHEDGRKLGRHPGIAHFTVGQRKGLGIADREPLYVIRIEPRSRRIVVGPRASLVGHDMELAAFNWLGGELPRRPRSVFAKIRSARPPCEAEIIAGEHLPRVRVLAGAHAVAPGQACVLYERPGSGARVLGGGFIARANRIPGDLSESVPAAKEAVVTA